MKLFRTVGGARVRYRQQRSDLVLVEICRAGPHTESAPFWFSRRSWDELTAVLFPAEPSYTVDLDVWLPEDVDVEWFREGDTWFYRPLSAKGREEFAQYSVSELYPGFYAFKRFSPEVNWHGCTFREKAHS